MIQNLKVDIIYHQTASDFEMEFNLCGCCRMRLLNEKTTDKKGFVRALARDVSRSRVIIACGPLFGEDGIIQIVAAAIGNGVTVCNNKMYGINGDEKIEIIKGSTPLVTSDGYFGGCIIESGPQTIILLTENRTFRKTIMQNLIHPYIEDISYIQPQNINFGSGRHTAAPTEPEQPEIAENEGYITDVDSDYEADDGKNGYDVVQNSSDEHNIEFIMDEQLDDLPTAPEVSVQNAEYDNLYTQIEDEKDIKERYEQSFVSSAEDNMFISSPERDDDLPAKGGKRSLNITIVVLVIILLLAVLALAYFVFLKPHTMGMSTGEYLREIFSTSSTETLF